MESFQYLEFDLKLQEYLTAKEIREKNSKIAEIDQTASDCFDLLLDHILI